MRMRTALPAQCRQSSPGTFANPSLHPQPGSNGCCRRRRRGAWVLRWLGQQQGIFGAHVLIRLLPGQRLLLTEPYRLLVRLDFLEVGHVTGNRALYKYQMPPKAGLDRPLPRTDREFRNRQGELRAEFLAEKVRPAIAVILLEHERIGERSGELRILRLAGKLRQGLHRVVTRVRRAAIGGEVEMPEA